MIRNESYAINDSWVGAISFAMQNRPAPVTSKGW